MLQCEIIGNLGSDAVVKELSGKKYVSFNVAHTEMRRDAGGNRVKNTVWVSVLWYGDGGSVMQYLTRGTSVFVRGRLSARTWTDRNGNVQVPLDVNASEVTLCGSARQEQPQQTSAQPSAAAYAAYGRPQQPVQASAGDEDDLPF